MAIDRKQAEAWLRAGAPGIQQWNQRRLAGEDIPALDDVDLSNANLRGVDLQGADLTGANLSQADLSGANFSNATLRNVVFVEAILVGAIFSGAVLSGADLRRTEFVLAPGSAQQFEQLKLFHDYTKWHVQLYAGGTVASLVLTELVKGCWMLVPLICFLFAAACAGTLLGNASRFSSEAVLNRERMAAFGRIWGVMTGARVRVAEKLFFWSGALSLVAVVYFRPETSPPPQCCIAVPASAAIAKPTGSAAQLPTVPAPGRSASHAGTGAGPRTPGETR